jgi:hypothetical protein
MAGRAPGGKGATNRKPNTRSKVGGLTGVARSEEGRRKSAPGGFNHKGGRGNKPQKGVNPFAKFKKGGRK